MEIRYLYRDINQRKLYQLISMQAYTRITLCLTHIT